MSNILLTRQIVLQFFTFFHQMKLFLPIALCLILLSGVLAVASLHLPCSLHPNILCQELPHVICLP